VSGELDGGSEQGSGERIGGKDQYSVTAQLSVPALAAGGCRDRGWVCEQETHHPASRARMIRRREWREDASASGSRMVGGRP
jgi:hypothetical protein